MFCSTCGSEVAEGLRFCNRCGASLGGEKRDAPRTRGLIIILSLAVAAVTIVGLLFILILGIEMSGRRDLPSETYIFLAVIFLTVLAADALMVRQISRLLTVYLRSDDEPATRQTKAPAILKTPAPELATPTTAETRPLTVETQDQELPTRKL